MSDYIQAKIRQNQTIVDSQTAQGTVRLKNKNTLILMKYGVHIRSVKYVECECKKEI